jgi:hypothetical protein
MTDERDEEIARLKGLVGRLTMLVMEMQESGTKVPAIPELTAEDQSTIRAILFPAENPAEN